MYLFSEDLGAVVGLALPFLLLASRSSKDLELERTRGERKKRDEGVRTVGMGFVGGVWGIGEVLLNAVCMNSYHPW
jgi:hypothetical protein